MKNKGFWVRFVAFLIDFIIYESVFAILCIKITLAIEFNPYIYKPEILFFWLACGLLLPWLANVIISTLTGTTPGKWICRAKIVDAMTGEKPS
ncbi:MAG: RDD family protein, partial [Candidatus Cloacimonetes bacterium]|nr:RDD family protein [Candidatus Cloacimonadota bacterium]